MIKAVLSQIDWVGPQGMYLIVLQSKVIVKHSKGFGSNNRTHYKRLSVKSSKTVHNLLSIGPP